MSYCLVLLILWPENGSVAVPLKEDGYYYQLESKVNWTGRMQIHPIQICPVGAVDFVPTKMWARSLDDFYQVYRVVYYRK